MLVVIGSAALKALHPFQREPKDIDIVGSYSEVMTFAKHGAIVRECYPINEGKKYVIMTDIRIIEAEIAWPGSSAEQLVQLVRDDPDTIHQDYGPGIAIASFDVLYLLKMSHRYLKDSPHFRKTMRDIQTLRALGATIRDEHKEFFKARQKATYTYGHPKLNVDKKGFFTGDGVHYVYDHDTIHLAMAQDHQPAYKFYQPATAEVNVSKQAFFAQPERVQLNGVLEEAYVLALERSLIPFAGKLTPKKAFNMALMKVCTSVTSGWFREFAYEHYDAVQELYRDDYVTRFWQAVEAGIVRRI